MATLRLLLLAVLSVLIISCDASLHSKFSKREILSNDRIQTSLQEFGSNLTSDEKTTQFTPDADCSYRGIKLGSKFLGFLDIGRPKQTLCACFEGYTGDKCQYEPCAGKDCSGRGQCKTVSQNSTDFKCECVEPYHGEECKENKCTDFGDCLNGGDIVFKDNKCSCESCWPLFHGDHCEKCVHCGNHATCKLKGSITPICTCIDGYTGATCRDLSTPTNDPCQNGGNVTYQYNSTTSQWGTTCTCPPVFYGKFCEETNCSPGRNPCKNGASCDTGTSGSEGKARCLCIDGFQGETCEHETCGHSYCANNGKCVSTREGEYCVCESGFIGSRCEQVLCGTSVCQHGTCATLDGWLQYCKCEPGYFGSMCDNSHCDDLNVCSGYGQACVGEASGEGYRCDCPGQRTGENCEQPPCMVNPCLNGGKCAAVDDILAKCLCQPGFKGEKCQISVCTPTYCKNEGTCVVKNSTPTCNCPNNFKGPLCENEICTNGYCENSGKCNPKDLLPQCTCSVGWKGRTCREPVCTVQSCANGGSCIPNVDQTFNCSCPLEWIGQTCTIPVCMERSCANGGACMPQISGQFVCTCILGWKGLTCLQPVCSQQSCANGGICVPDTTGGFSCKCPSRYTGPDCAVDRCATIVCGPGSCAVAGDKIQCFCPLNFKGENCQTPACTGFSCSQFGRCVADDKNGPRCLCSPGYFGDHCEFNKCQNITCSNRGICEIKSSGDYKCQCPDTFAGVSCEQSKCLTCFNGGVCSRNVAGDYVCACKPGYSGNQCQLDACSPNPCAYGSCSRHFSNHYECQCSAEYAGKNCDEKVCSHFNRSCRNSGICLEDSTTDAGFSCQCSDGFHGQQCEIDPCEGNPCHHGGQCYRNGTSASRYYCRCPAGFVGASCETDLCADASICKPNGDCVRILNRQLLPDYSCKCRLGWTGRNCTTNICSSNRPCENGAICQPDIYGQRTCICQSGFAGSTCSVNIDDCVSNPCVNGRCSDLINGFLCTCTHPYIGKHCDITPCTTNNCNRYGTETCVPNQLAKSENDYTCKCKPGYMKQDCSQHYCGIPETCSTGLSQGTCSRMLSRGSLGYRCICMDGYTGSDCEKDIDECLQPDGSPTCLHNATNCINLVNAFSCTCASGFQGARCETHICDSKIAPCLNGGQCDRASYNPAIKGEMTPTGPGYQCRCRDGFDGENCQDDACKPKPCGENGVCLRKPYGGYSCDCEKGYNGTHCNLDLCAATSKPCNGAGQCLPEEGGFSCICDIGFTGTHCQTDLCENEPCGRNGICQRRPNSYACICAPGFAGIHCEIDLCSSGPCLYGGTCLPKNITVGGDRGYDCICAVGFEGFNCEINKCQELGCNTANLDRCPREDPRCICAEGWTGATCNQSKCLTCFNGGGCSKNATGGYSCACKPGYSGNQCQLDVCSPNPCVYGSCSRHFSNRYECQCSAGYAGKNCDEKVCSHFNRSCRNSGICSEDSTADDGFSCRCSNGFHGQQCEIDPCEGNPCQHFGYCYRNGTSASRYYCRCSAGFVGASCEIDLCADASICKPNGDCIRIINRQQLPDYSCKCTLGWTDRNCTTNICSSNRPCENGATCLPDIYGQRMCICPPGFTGSTCSVNIDDCVSNPCVNGNCSDLINGFLCTCTHPYIGKHCDITPCTTNNCNRYSTRSCVPNQQAKSENDYTCKCRTGYLKQDCSQHYCDIPETCGAGLSRGVCRRIRRPSIWSTGYQCICKDGYTGSECEKDINGCLQPDGSPTCLHNATNCVNLVNDFNCTCTSGFQGGRCETHICDSKIAPCLNGGQCERVSYTPASKGEMTSTGSGYQCTCMDGFVGQNCQIVYGRGDDGTDRTYFYRLSWPPASYDTLQRASVQTVADQCVSNPCKNGAKCKGNEVSFDCDCTPGYKGKDCSDSE